MGLFPTIEKFGDAPVRHAAKTSAEITPELDFAGTMKALARRATILREWLLFLERYPLILTANSWRGPLPIDADQVGHDETRALFKAQGPLFVLPRLGLPGLSVP